MNLRGYQTQFVERCLGALVEYNRVLGVAPTGSGKTIMAAEMVRRYGGENVLFLADAKTLVWQCADKFEQYGCGHCGVEMADSRAAFGDKVVIATTQSIARRLDKWPRGYFGLIIVDEAHRNTLGAQAQKVLGHFSGAQVVGITATPFRSDKKQLGTFFETIACEIALRTLIKDGFLSPIKIKSVPSGVSLREVRTKSGDYREDDLGKALNPHLTRLAELLKEHAPERKTVVFLPLIETSKAFAAECRKLGMAAVHVDGVDRSALGSNWRVICNSALLTTGWDCPDVDCVYILRPTKSQTLYSQMVGRGTRVAQGKKDLLLLDPLYLSETVDLIRPARLIARNADEAKAVQMRLDAGDGGDLLEAEAAAKRDREQAMLERAQRMSSRSAKTVDALELAVSLNDEDLGAYEPVSVWESKPITEGQARYLEKVGMNLASITCKGHASRIIDRLIQRREQGLATPKQLRWLVRLRVPNANQVSFDDARKILDRRFGR